MSLSTNIILKLPVYIGNYIINCLLNYRMLKIIIKTFFTVLVIAGIILLVAYKSYEFGEQLSAAKF